MARQPAVGVTLGRSVVRGTRLGGGARVAALVTVAGAWLLAGPAAVLADCAPPPPVPEAVAGSEVVFVGTVVGITAGDRWAKVQVEEAWKGGDPGPTVEVRGGESFESPSTIDRFFAVGRRYLFVLGPGFDGFYLDNGCSATTEWRDELLEARPADWFVPRGGEGPVATAPPAQSPGVSVLAALTGPAAVVGVVGVIAVVVIGGSWLVARRRVD